LHLKVQSEHMPFCRKCGRRLVEYSEVCTDCGTSTTAPIINIKGKSTKVIITSEIVKPAALKKVARAVIPTKTIIQVKTITPTQSSSIAKTTQNNEQIKINITKTPTKTIIPIKTTATTTTIKPIAQVKSVATTRPFTTPNPVLSAKHIVKPKKVVQTKPTAPFTINFARPYAAPTITQPKHVASPKPITQPKPFTLPPIIQPTPITPIIQQKPIAQSTPVIQPKPVTQITPVVVPLKPAFEPKTVPPPKPVTPAAVYPPHEIIKSKVSLKEDIIAHPEDYETQAFDFNLKCPNGHFWREGKQLPVSKGKAYCLKCGELLRKPKPKQHRRPRRSAFL